MTTEQDIAYEAGLDIIRGARLARWRGVAYYKCVNCFVSYNLDRFYIVQVCQEDAAKTFKKISLQPLCSECYVELTKGRRSG